MGLTEEDKQWFRQQLERSETKLIAEFKHVETTLIAEFHKWTLPTGEHLKKRGGGK